MRVRLKEFAKKGRSKREQNLASTPEERLEPVFSNKKHWVMGGHDHQAADLSFPTRSSARFSKPIEQVDPEVLKLADDMLETMYDARSRHWSRPIQIALPRRLLVVDVAPRRRGKGADRRDQSEIVRSSDERSVYEKAACPFRNIMPRWSAPRRSPSSISGVTARRTSWKLDGLLATCLQHEIDHLKRRAFSSTTSRA